MKLLQSKYSVIKARYFFILILFLFLFWFSLPSQIFVDPTSTILYSQEGKLLGARIAKDGQWRFPDSQSVPFKFEKALLHFEDKYFYYHLGVNPISIIRAFKQKYNRWESSEWR